MNTQTRYTLFAPNGDSIVECDHKGLHFVLSDAERIAVETLAVGESYLLADEVGDFKMERTA